MKDHKKIAEIILSSTIDKDRYRIGNSKVFFRAGVLGYLEEVRDDIVNKLIRFLQGAVRGHFRRKEYERRLLQRLAEILIFHLLLNGFIISAIATAIHNSNPHQINEYCVHLISSKCHYCQIVL